MWQFRIAEGLDDFDALAGADAVGDVPLDRCRGVHVVARENERTAGFADTGQSSHRDHAALRVAYAQPLHIVDVIAILAVGLYDNLPRPAKAIEVIDIAGTQIGLQCAEDISELHSLTQAFLAIDIHKQLRRIGLINRKQAGQLGVLIGLFHDVVGLLLQHFQTAVAVFDHQFEAAGTPQAGDGGGRKDVDERLGNLSRVAFSQCCKDLIATESFAFSIGEILQDDEHRTEVGAVGTQHERVTSDGVDVLDAGGLHRDLFDTRDDVTRSSRGGRIGQLNAGQEIALVLTGNEAGRQLPVAPER